MMQWKEIGTFQPSLDRWQVIGIATDAKTFKLTFLGFTAPGRSYVRIRQHFSNDEVSLSERFYPKAESVVFEMPIPDDLISAGQGFRHLSGIKFLTRWYTPEQQYSIKLEALL